MPTRAVRSPPITRRDIKGPALYATIRDDYRNRVIALKRPRRVLIGDRVSLMFENRFTLTMQIEEMCRAEGLTRDDQIVADALDQSAAGNTKALQENNQKISDASDRVETYLRRQCGITTVSTT